jgi:hypothetical protein
MSLYCTSSNGRWRTRSRSIWEGNPRVTCPFLYLEISSTKILKKEPFTKMGYWHFFLAQNKTSDGYFVAQKKVLLLQPRSAAYSFLYLNVHQSMRQTDIRTREIKYKSSSNSVPTPTQCSIFSLKFNFNSLFQKKTNFNWLSHLQQNQSWNVKHLTYYASVQTISYWIFWKQRSTIAVRPGQLTRGSTRGPNSIH